MPSTAGLRVLESGGTCWYGQRSSLDCRSLRRSLEHALVSIAVHIHYIVAKRHVFFQLSVGKQKKYPAVYVEKPVICCRHLGHNCTQTFGLLWTQTGLPSISVSSNPTATIQFYEQTDMGSQSCLKARLASSANVLSMNELCSGNPIKSAFTVKIAHQQTKAREVKIGPCSDLSQFLAFFADDQHYQPVTLIDYQV